MSEDDQENDVDEPEEEIEEPVEEDVDDEEQPEIEEDDVAAITPEMSADLEGVSDDEDDDQESIDDSDVPDVDGAEDLEDFGFGRFYVNGLATGSTVLVASKRDEEWSEDDVEDYRKLAKSMEIDRFADAWAEEHIDFGADPENPSTALLASTAMFVGIVGMENPDVSMDILDGIGGDDDE